MAAVALMIRPTKGGWGVYLTSGQEIVRYRGLASKWRALRYLAAATRTGFTGVVRPRADGASR
jgi:hypothetical protein